MKHASHTQSLCPFCQKNTASACLNCSHTVKVNEISENIHNDTQDLNATERVLSSATDLYRQAMEQSTSDTDATERVALPAATDLYRQALERSVAHSTVDDDETEQVSLPAATELYRQVLAQPDTDATRRVSSSKATTLYRQALEQSNAKQADTLAQKSVDSPPESSAQEKQPTQKATASTRGKRSTRRGFLGVFRLFVDILLLLALLGCSGLTIEAHITQTRLAQQAGVVRQQSLQFQAQLQLLQKQQLQLQQQQQQAQLKTNAQALVKHYNQEVQSWGKAHLYHDSYDGHSYMLDSGYTQVGIGTAINNDLAAAQTGADFQDVLNETQNALFNLQMMEADYKDHTPYNKVHATDLDILNYYQLSQKTVLLVSTSEQVMRVYQQGKLVRSFYITTGRTEKPSLPGIWSVLDRRSPVIFTSGDPPGSPYWFPNTPINYAILYHFGGFFLHDAPWRGSFGPGTEFPHQDASGNTPYNFDGSHGCVNLSEADASWVYHNTDWNTTIVIY